MERISLGEALRSGPSLQNLDRMMWSLHQIRHKMAKKKLNFSEINKLAIEFQNTPNPRITHKNKKVR